MSRRRRWSDPYAPWFLRKLVYKRDAGQCQYCGAEVTIAECNIDHVIPRRHRGATTKRNLVVACPRCNALKEGQLIPEELRPRKGEAFATRKQRKEGQRHPWNEAASQAAKDRIAVIREASALGIELDDLFSEAEQERWAG